MHTLNNLPRTSVEVIEEKVTHTLPRTAAEVITEPASAHPYTPPNGASRSPCPCLNTMANHSYLPHDGRNITYPKLVSALQKGMGLSRGFAIFMAIGTFVLLRRPSFAPFNLHGAARHNFIEHNASMVHADARPNEEFAPCAVDHKLLNEFLAKAHPSRSSSGSSGESVISMHDIAERRVEREAVSLPVDAFHAELGRAEFAMVMEIFGEGKEKELDRARLEVFLKENRIPDGWSPSHKMHLWEAFLRSAAIRHAMHDVKRKAEREPVRAHDGGSFEWFKSIVKKLVGHDSSL